MTIMYNTNKNAGESMVAEGLCVVSRQGNAEEHQAR